jgi:uncharacterized protein
MGMQIPIDRERVARFCQKWRIRELSLYGSVLRSDFGPRSDVDVLVTFAPGGGITFGNYVLMTDELTDIFGRPVDLVEREAIEQSPNYIRRRHILGSLEAVYVAG